MQAYFDLIVRLNPSDINRSENDLSSNLKDALTSYGLWGVLDTGAGADRLKRPDIALYSDSNSADLGVAADVVVECKKPNEIARFSSLVEALADETLWNDKFKPYVTAHAERIRFFVFTTFEQVLVIPISQTLRRNIIDNSYYKTKKDRLAELGASTLFDLRKPNRQQIFAAWCQLHLTPEALYPLPLSNILDLTAIKDAGDLETFASALADVVVGPENARTSASLMESIRLDATCLEELPGPTRRALVIYTMSAHGGMTAEQAEKYLLKCLADELFEFLSASIHSLVGRLFAVKTIEDAFCLGVDPPLVPKTHWVFHSTQFDALDSNDLAARFFEALSRLESVPHPAVRDLAATGRFYDWLAPEVDPMAFRRLLELFTAHSLGELNGDLLGRFFEIYAQRIDRRRRRELGQYYTPSSIVSYLWKIALEVVREKQAESHLIVLDPGVGSGTFLTEGARRLNDLGVTAFWERLHGFDIAPQVIAIAQVNLYLAILALLDRSDAESVGSLKLYPTDSLDPKNGAHLRTVLTLMTEESVRNFLLRRIQLSEEIKRRSRFPLVIGNPPYKHNPNRTLIQMAEVFPSLLRSTRANARAQENTIREDYAWFFAAADYYLEGEGIIAFVGAAP